MTAAAKIHNPKWAKCPSCGRLRKLAEVFIHLNFLVPNPPRVKREPVCGKCWKKFPN